MKILVTGYKGFIGSHMYHSLQAQGHEVEGYEWGDKNLPDVMDKDWVVHIGAISSTVERDLEKIMRQNVDFSINLYNECKTFGVNFQFSSSASLYGMNSDFSENAVLDPRTPYAWSKYLVERYIQQNPMSAATQIFRYFNVYGPEGEEHKQDQASPHYKFKKQFESQGHIEVFEGSENYRRDFIHVDDVVKIQQKFFDKDVNGIFNIGSGKTKSFLEVAKLYSSNIIEIPMPESLKFGYQKYTCADMTKTYRELFQ